MGLAAPDLDTPCDRVPEIGGQRGLPDIAHERLRIERGDAGRVFLHVLFPVGRSGWDRWSVL